MELRRLWTIFHEHEVNVLIGYTPWEVLTRNHGLESNFTKRSYNLIFRLKIMGFNGYNGDALTEDSFINQYNQNHPMAIELEQDSQGDSF
jgi:hypothetical protein